MTVHRQVQRGELRAEDWCLGTHRQRRSRRGPTGAARRRQPPADKPKNDDKTRDDSGMSDGSGQRGDYDNEETTRRPWRWKAEVMMYGVPKTASKMLAIYEAKRLAG